jgi:hypothetical protein
MNRKQGACAGATVAPLLVGCFMQALLWMPGCGGSTGWRNDLNTAGDASEDISLSDLIAEGGVQSDVQSPTYRIMPSSDADVDADAATTSDAAYPGHIFPQCLHGCCQSNGNGTCKTDCNQCDQPCATPACGAEQPCATPACNALTCPMSCCDSKGQCVWNGGNSSTACGLCGATCIDCTSRGTNVCQFGQCYGPHG